MTPVPRRFLILLSFFPMAVFAQSLDLVDSGKFSAASIPAQLVCEGVSYEGDALKSLDIVMSRYGIRPGRDDLNWAERLLKDYDNRIRNVQNTANFSIIAALLRRGLSVSAKIAHDAARTADAAYRDSALSFAVSQHLTASTTPIPVGEAESGEASKQLRGAIRRAKIAKGSLGALYDMPVVRYYVLGHAFDDPIAINVAGSMICASNFSPDAIGKIGAGAEFAKYRGRDARPPKSMPGAKPRELAQ